MWGLAVRTTDGLRRVGAINSARLIHQFSVNAASGSVTVAGFDSTRGFIFAPSLIVAPWTWNNTTKVLSWSDATILPVTVMFFLRS